MMQYSKTQKYKMNLFLSGTLLCDNLYDKGNTQITKNQPLQYSTISGFPVNKLNLCTLLRLSLYHDIYEYKMKLASDK